MYGDIQMFVLVLNSLTFNFRTFLGTERLLVQSVSPEMSEARRKIPNRNG